MLDFAEKIKKVRKRLRLLRYLLLGQLPQNHIRKDVLERKKEKKTIVTIKKKCAGLDTIFIPCEQ